MATSPADVRMCDLPEFSLRCSKPSAAPCAPMLLSLVPARNTPECLSIVFNVVQKERLRVDSGGPASLATRRCSYQAREVARGADSKFHIQQSIDTSSRAMREPGMSSSRCVMPARLESTGERSCPMNAWICSSAVGEPPASCSTTTTTTITISAGLFNRVQLQPERLAEAVSSGPSGGRPTVAGCLELAG